MARGHNKEPGPSKAQREARRQPRFREFPKAKPNYIIDDRVSQRIKARKKAPDWIQVKKGQYEKVPGTRIQMTRGGFPVRRVIADGKDFPPEKVGAAKKHLRMLFQQEKEKLEIDRIINGKAATKVLPEPPRWIEKTAKRTTSKLTLSKKARRREELMERRQLHEERTKRDGREIVSDEFHFGEVVEAAPNRAMVRLLHPESIALLSTLRASALTASVGESRSVDGAPPVPIDEQCSQALAASAGESRSVDGVPPAPIDEQALTASAGESRSADGVPPAPIDEQCSQAPAASAGDSHSVAGMPPAPIDEQRSQVPSALGSELRSPIPAPRDEPQASPDSGSKMCGQSLITGSQVSSPSSGDLRGQCSQASASSSELHSQACPSGESTSQVSGSADLLPIGFADVAEAGLRLVPGVAVRFKLYTDKNGVGGCEAASRESEGSQPPHKKRKKLTVGKKGAATAAKSREPQAPGVELSVKTGTADAGLSAVAAAETVPGLVA